jgi:hypothetical protein
LRISSSISVSRNSMTRQRRPSRRRWRWRRMRSAAAVPVAASVVGGIAVISQSWRRSKPGYVASYPQEKYHILASVSRLKVQPALPPHRSSRIKVLDRPQSRPSSRRERSARNVALYRAGPACCWSLGALRPSGRPGFSYLLDSEQFKFITSTVGARVGTLGSVSGDRPAASTGKRREIMMHPYVPGPRPLAVPGIGFPQNISIGSDVRAPAAFGDSSDNHRASTRPIDRIIWLPSPRQWFAVQS